MSAKNMLPIDRDDASAEWFDAAAEGRLLIRRCAEGHLSAPQTTTCPQCGSTELQWTEVAPRGSLASYSVFHRRDTEALPVAIVELADGPWLRMQVQDVEDDALRVGLPVEIRFAAPEGGEHIPYAVPVA